ncbi:polysaccharide deacetylase family protein [Flavisphingomonas formosensis]|uniref:polysaccharide deacetylase family protein n=1 Tax=Flavisphingomonas formosensis TaxID=861534 RepID=UPI0012FA4F2D|nr:hypothetical protein [Sphingomonas formosensis]
MTAVLITVDTELSALLQQRGMSASANLASSIGGEAAGGAYGVGWQMDRLEEQGLTGIFFVDPMPALVHGPALVADMIGPILARGHDVQLHIHTEWLEWAKQSPVEGRRGTFIADFSRADQRILLSLARDLLVEAGAPAPIAFRAGNYGANDDTLAVLAELGIGWDSSVNADYLGGACRVSLAPDRHLPVRHQGVVELPVSGLYDRPGHFRPAQICALSAWEMGAALDHAAGAEHPVFTIVTHSFEMLSRDRSRPNISVMRRFEALCRAIARDPRLRTARFADLDAERVLTGNAPRLGPNRLRTLARIGEQAIATWCYERQLRPA